MLLYPLYYDIINLTSLKITQVFYLLSGFVENQIIFWDFKIHNSIWIMEIQIIEVLLYCVVYMLLNVITYECDCDCIIYACIDTITVTVTGY